MDLDAQRGFEPGHRRAQIALGLLLLLSVGIFHYLQGIIAAVLLDIDGLLASEPALGVRLAGRLLLWLVVFSGAMAVAIAVYLWLLALRVRRSGRYPPPAMPVALRTRVRTGEKAERMAVACRWLALLLLLQPLLGVWLWFALTGAAL